MPLPDISDLREIRFRETRRDGDFTEAVLELNPDGTGTNRKTSRYGESVYKSEKQVDAGTISAIKNSIGSCGMMAWAGLPESGCLRLSDKSMTFVFGGSDPITIGDDRSLPSGISGGFFNIELEMTTKH